MNGIIIKILSNQYTVKVDNKEYICTPRGKFRNDKITPVVGDKCIIDEENNYILKILPRTNQLSRPMVANIDIALIVTSVKQPDLSLNLLDKMLSIITINNIKPIICFTKLDLLNNNELKEIKRIRKYYQSIGISVYDNKHIWSLKRALRNKIVVFTGQTGAGKSSLLNKIDRNLNLHTNEISKALNRGKHTTRHVELFTIKKLCIVDTPGFSAIDLSTYSKEDIRDSFIEFNNYKCDFKDCMHINEKKCAIKEAVLSKKILPSRYENYKNFIGK